MNNKGLNKKHKCIWGLPTTGVQTKIVSEYDQEIPQSQTADNPVAPRGRAAQPSPGRQIKQSNQLSFPHQDDCDTRMDISLCIIAD